METYFYVMGIVLVLLALGISAAGIRSDNFPSAGILRVGVLIVALVVGATAYGAVQLSEDEEQHRLEEENVEASEEAESTTEEETETAGEGTPAAEEESGGSGAGPSAEASGASLAADGEQVFLDNGCGSCHSLAALGSEAQGTVGPNLDEALLDEDAAFIETSIVDPSAEVEEGFGDNIMPSDYGTSIEPQDLEALVAFLVESTQGGAGGSGGSGSTEK
jgi:mono/diheme cytochrome c family protein